MLDRLPHVASDESMDELWSSRLPGTTGELLDDVSDGKDVCSAGGATRYSPLGPKQDAWTPCLGRLGNSFANAYVTLTNCNGQEGEAILVQAAPV